MNRWLIGCRCRLASIITPLAVCVAAASAQHFPDRPIRYLVPSSAGSGSDFIARIIAIDMAQTLGQQFVIDNRAGGGGNIAAELGAHAPADGYTLFQVSITHAINVSLYARLSYDLVRDFVPVTLLGTQANLVVVNASFPVKSVEELIKFAKARPGEINFSSSGVGSNSFLATELLNSMAGIKMVHVPYKGGGPAVAAVAAGEVALMVGPISTSQTFIQQGKLRGIAISSGKRLQELPQYPTVSETLPGFVFDTWYGLMLPARTPRGVVEVVHRTAVNALGKPAIAKHFSSAGVRATPMRSDEFGAFLKSEIEKLAMIIRQTSARAE